MAHMLCIQEGEPTFRASSSETQSEDQMWSAGKNFKQSRTLTLQEHPSCFTMKSVRSLLTLRDHMSAGGEWNITREKSPAEPVATMWTRMMPAPSLWPSSVTIVGS